MQEVFPDLDPEPLLRGDGRDEAQPAGRHLGADAIPAQSKKLEGLRHSVIPVAWQVPDQV